MNSARTMPCVLVLPPRSNPPGFQSGASAAWKLAMIESTNSSSPGKQPLLGERRASRRRAAAIDQRGDEARDAGRAARRRTPGGRRDRSGARSAGTQRQQVSTSRLRSAEPVLARRHRSAGVRVHGGTSSSVRSQEAQGADARAGRSRRRRRTVTNCGSPARRALGPAGLRQREAVGGRAVGAAAGGCRAAGRSRRAGRRNLRPMSQALCTNSNWRAMLALRQMKCRPGSAAAPVPASACSGDTAAPYSRPRRSSR